MKHFKPKLSIIISAIVISLVFFQSCETDTEIETTDLSTSINTSLKTINFDKNVLEVSQIFENNEFQFKTIKKENIVSSKFIIKNTRKEIIYETEFNLDASIEDYKLYQVKKVIHIANNLNYELELNDYLKISEQLNEFIDNIVTQYRNQQIKPLLESLFFHNSILNSKKRSLKNNEDNCDCTLHPGYLLEKTGFFCQEDYLMTVNIVKSTINKNKDAFSDSGSVALIQYLNSTSEEFITFDILYEFYIEKELYLQTLDLIKNKDNAKNSQTRGDCAWWCPLGCGSSWGCCGNYSGCCLFHSPLCLIHDALCTNCEPAGFCLDGCVPDNPQP